MNLDLDKGGRAAIERMIDAYGCGTKTALAELLGISKGTLSNRYLRDTFPADYVIKCALETGVSLLWLATGAGVMFDSNTNDIISIPRKKLVAGVLYDSNNYLFDRAMLPKDIVNPVAIVNNQAIYITENINKRLSNGLWLINFNDEYSIKNISILPAKKIRVEDPTLTFECNPTDLHLEAKVRISIMVD